MAGNKSTYIVAEAGVNHNGSMELARRLVEVAAEAGVDSVKFQTFRSGELTAEDAPKADYQTETTDADESQAEMLRRLELSPEQHNTIAEHCADQDLQFLSTPFDAQSAKFLVDEFNVPRIKIGSGELTNGPLLLRIARLGRPVILSTGMGTLGEVEQALSVLAYGYVSDGDRPTSEQLDRAFASTDGQNALDQNVTVLHCVTEYPAPVEAANLRVMDTLREAFRLPVGLSDHTEGITIPVAAVARGATLIEKHFTLDRSLPGPDHEASLEPDELYEMVQGIRNAEAALGTARKVPTDPEWKNRPVARKSLVATQTIEEGEKLTSENLGVKRPGDGTPPMRYWEYLGTIASRSYKPNEQVQ
ncbi:N-acetylneuraminate synthase [Salinibacter ruber]|uniref:N-acetylneuraminate synthase n=1 Tax=Salinibacter ruber TaxID=146919 RepID=UPI002169650F|nr:N-acetylneuraminate synthase [Salinibacter ruber]MCS4116723.1 N-acetylneuraminate synthase [Salinibacter ruber]MCS4168671.1 N-acetylneuraminate synthase [Salinibacter ruber]